MAKNYNDESGRKKTNNSIVKELERLERLRNEHRGEWITIEDCKEYYNRAKACFKE